MLCEVLKPISGPGGVQYTPGQTVDTAEWRWASQLVTQRKLRPVESHVDSPPATEVKATFKRGRPRKNPS
jgi:hypothetical protein